MASNHESTATWRVDITQLKSAMQDAKRSISLATAEFKTAAAGMDKWEDSTTGLEAKLKQLNSTLPQQKSILENLEKQYKLTAENMGENSAEAQRLKIQIENQRAAIVKTEKQIGDYNTKLNQLQAEQKEADTDFGKLNKTIQEQEKQLASLKEAYAKAVINFGENSDKAKDLASQIKSLSSDLKENKAQMQSANQAADELDVGMANLDDSARGVADGFTVFKGALANLVSQGIRAAIQGIKNLVSEVYNAGSSFEANMSQVEAISGATGTELDRLSAKAKLMGETTKFSAAQSAEAFNYMAMAGWKTEDMLNGIEGVMNLAAAANTDLATASSIVTDALSAMGYEAKDATQLADVMAAAASNANTTIELMGNTFQYAAPLVGAMGYSMEDTAIAIGLMANSGVKGEKAGTALRAVLTRLSAPPAATAAAIERLGITLTDSEGHMKSFREVMNDLRKAFANLSETEQAAEAKHLAGQEALSGFLAIVRSSDEDFNKLAESIDNSSGAAQDMANTMLDNVSGAITILKSKIEGIMIKVFEKASKAIRKAIDTVSKALDNVDWDAFAEGAGNALNKVADLFAYIVKNGDKILSVLKTIAVAFVTYKAVTTIMSVASAFTSLFSLVKSGTSIITAFSSALGLSPYALVVAGLAAVVTGLIQYTKHQQEAIAAEYGLTDAQKENLSAARELAESYAELDKARNESIAAVNSEYAYIEDLKQEYNSLIDSNGNVKKGYEERASFIINELAEAMGLEEEEIQKLIEKNGQLGESIDKVIEKKKAQALLNANEEAYNAAIKGRTDALSKLANAQKELDETDKKRQETQKAANEVNAEFNRLMGIGAVEAAQNYLTANAEIIDGNRVANAAWEQAKKDVDAAKEAWVGYNTTIQQYEGLAAAIQSGDSAKIQEAMGKLSQAFITVETGNRESLEKQVADMEHYYEGIKLLIDNNTPGVTQEMLDQAAAMVQAAKDELDKLPPEAGATGTEAGDELSNRLEEKVPDAETAGKKVGKGANKGAQEGSSGMEGTGETAGADFVEGVGSNSGDANAEGKELANEAVAGAKSQNGEKGGAQTAGSNFGSGFISGIGKWIKEAWNTGWELAINAQRGALEAQQSHSPSRVMMRVGGYFGEGFTLGISDMTDSVVDAASNMAKKAIDAVDTTMSDQLKAIGENGANDLINGINSVMPEVSNSINNLKVGVAGANSAINGSLKANEGTFSATSGESKVQNVTFNQYNNSPKALDRLSLYRQTNNMLFAAKVGLKNV